MTTETRYYGGDSWGRRKVIIHHGANESYVIYDSENGRYDCWNYKPKLTKLQKWLKRAKDNDDL